MNMVPTQKIYKKLNKNIFFLQVFLNEIILLLLQNKYIKWQS